METQPMSRDTHGVKQERGAFFLEYLVMVSHKAIPFFPQPPSLAAMWTSCYPF